MTATLLETVARHESILILERDKAREDGRARVEEAHASANGHAQKIQTELDAAMAERRQAASAERVAVQRDIETQAEARVAQIRESADAKRQTAKDELIALLVPDRK